jgi:ribosomal protein S18 acetylase RimI-like enzyme
MSFVIRPATRRDALHLAALIDIAGHGIEVPFWIDQSEEEHAPLAAARRLAMDEESLPYHHSKAHLLESDGEIAAGVFGDLIPDTPQIHPDEPDYLLPLLELENACPGYWAVIGIAVFPEFRGRGMSRQLLDHALSQARLKGAKGLSIVVEDTNTQAIGLYRRWGFADRETKRWLPYGKRTGPNTWVLLTKEF